jgi:hypothetical protein
VVGETRDAWDCGVCGARGPRYSQPQAAEPAIDPVVERIKATLDPGYYPGGTQAKRLADMSLEELKAYRRAEAAEDNRIAFGNPKKQRWWR